MAEIPGVAEDELDVSVHRDTVTLRGERKTYVGGPKGYHRCERAGSALLRTLSLPSCCLALRVVRFPQAPSEAWRLSGFHPPQPPRTSASPLYEALRGCARLLQHPNAAGVVRG